VKTVLGPWVLGCWSSFSRGSTDKSKLSSRAMLEARYAPKRKSREPAFLCRTSGLDCLFLDANCVHKRAPEKMEKRTHVMHAGSKGRSKKLRNAASTADRRGILRLRSAAPLYAQDESLEVWNSPRTKRYADRPRCLPISSSPPPLRPESEEWSSRTLLTCTAAD
jgi:hypothetical protein